MMQDELRDPFRGVMIEDCFVFGWRLEGKALEVELLLSLWPSNEHYERPKAGEWTCYKEATLTLKNVCKLEKFVHVDDAMIFRDPDGSIDYGCLDAAIIEGDSITIYGPFGGASLKISDLGYVINETLTEVK
ncbi:MAG: hypothetical protein MK096_02785 [Oleiphilaceae bacterium]|nr:hypothetical protein [Oleiphilaceae bacterium]